MAMSVGGWRTKINGQRWTSVENNLGDTRLTTRKANPEISPSAGMQPLRRFPFSNVGPARTGVPGLADRVGLGDLDEGPCSRFPIL